MKKALPGLCFAALLLAFSALQLFVPDRAYSENENRFLQTLPSFSAQALIEGDFTAAFDTYIVDQFPLRDGFVSFKTLLEKWTGKRDSGGIYFAKDDYLIEMFDVIDQDKYGRNLEHLLAFTNNLGSIGIEPSILLVPSASGVLLDKLPAFAPEIDQEALLAQAKALGLPVIDVLPLLREHDSEYIYYKTDHHWTSYGAYLAYSAWREALGQAPAPLDAFEEEVLSGEFYGTTYSKANLYTAKPDTITAYKTERVSQVSYNFGQSQDSGIYALDHLATKDKYSVFLNGNQPQVQIEGFGPEGRKLLVIKDSYANCFMQFPLLDYEEVHVLDLRYYKLSLIDYVRENGISDVLILYNLKGFADDDNAFVFSMQ